jgi:hypothetical protein
MIIYHPFIQSSLSTTKTKPWIFHLSL